MSSSGSISSGLSDWTRSKCHDGYAELGITVIMPSSGLRCRLRHGKPACDLRRFAGVNIERPRSDGGDRLREHPKYVRQRVHLVAAALPHATPSDRHPAVRPDRKVPLSQAVSRIIRQATPNRTIRRRAKSRSRDRHPDGQTDQSLFFRWSFRIRGEFWRIRRKI